MKSIAARVGESYQIVYREIARNRKPDVRYQPWFAQNKAHLRHWHACHETICEAVYRGLIAVADR